MSVRAKFHCVSAMQTTFNRTYKFTAVTDSDTEENERYHFFTPFGELTLVVDNPAVKFKPGEYYYLDFNHVASVPVPA